MVPVPEQADPTPAASLGHILVVDDEVELVKVLREMLSAQGFDVVGVTSPTEALKILQEQTVDLLLADLMMPEMDGVRLLQAALEVDPHLVSIIMTGQGTVQTAVEAMKAGAFDYVLKPFKLNALLPVLTRAMEVRRLRLETIQLRDTVAIYELSKAIAFTIDTSTILAKVADGALQQTDADEVSIMLPTHEGDELYVAVTRGDHRDTILGQRVSFGQGIAGWVAQHREPLILNGEVNDPRFAPIRPRSNIHSAVCVPLLVGNKLVGLLNVNRTRHRRLFTLGQVKALTIFTSTAAAALETALLFEDANRRLQQLQALRAIDMAITGSTDLRVVLGVLLERVTAALDINAASVLLLNPYSQTLEFAAGRGFRAKGIEASRVRLGEGYAGRAALERRIISVPDLAAMGGAFVRSAQLAGEGFVSYHAAPLIAKGEVRGVLEVFHRTLHSSNSEWLTFLEALAGQAAIAIENGALFNNLQRSNAELVLAYDTTLEGWSRALDLRDKETEGHTQRVAELTLRLARTVGVSEEELIHVRRGALLHDIGKMGIPDSILLKPGPLTEEEWNVMRQHPVYAYELLLPIEYLRPALDIPYCHHEKWDGTGYPRGLKSEQIPLAARIFAVVDVWDALRSERPYRPAWSAEKAQAHIREQAGKHFDPKVVKAFLALEA